MKKLNVFLISCALFISMLVPSSILAENFEGQEAYYIAYCSKPLKTQEDADLCRSFKIWYTQKGDALQNQVDDLKNTIAGIQGELNIAGQKAQEYEDQINQLNLELEAIAVSIIEIEASIAELDIEIARKEEDIALRDQQIKDRMVDLQSYVGVNAYIDIIMGASDLVDLIRRVSVMQDITAYEQDQIDALNADIEALALDKAESERLKQDLEDNKVMLDSQKATYEELRAALDAKMAELTAQSVVLEAQQREQSQATQAIKDAVSQVQDTVFVELPSNASIRVPVNGYYYISAGTWYYPDSSTFHLGLDFAGSIGTDVVAPASGIIMYAANPAASNGGYLGNMVGWPYGGGNTISMVASVNGRTYMFSFFHLMQSPWIVSSGEQVVQGQKIAALGHSGNSTGPHLHFEVIDMGEMSVQQVYNNFQSTVDFAGGTGWNTSSACSSRGYTPCRARPEDLLGF